MAGQFSRETLLKGLGVLLCVLVILPTLIQRTDRADLRLLVNAGERLASGKAVYNLSDLDEHTKPPLCTWLFLPTHHVDFFLLGRTWDVLNLAVFIYLAFFFARRFLPGTKEKAGTLALLGCLFTLTAWNAEIRLGQFNVIGMGLVLLAEGGMALPLRGLALAVALLLKPTNIIFLPWLARFARRPLGLAVTTGACTLFMAVLYMWQFGITALWTDHLAWLAFLGPSTKKHILRFDNHGLPSLFATTFGHSFQNVFLGLGVLLVGLMSWRFPRHRWEVFSLACVLIIIFSPMAWPQNYSLMLPLVIWVWAEYFRGTKVVPALAVIYVTHQLHNPSTWDYWGPLGRWRLPLIGVGLSLALFFAAFKTTKAKRALESQPLKAPG